MPSGCLYTSQEFIDANPNTTQALANAIFRADQWIQKATPDEIAKVVPEGYLLGDPELYKLALKGNKEALSPDGTVAKDGPETALKALAAFVPNFPTDKIDISKIWTNDLDRKSTRLNSSH